jgi:hypothetical protein
MHHPISWLTTVRRNTIWWVAAACMGIASTCDAGSDFTADAVSYYFQELSLPLKMMYVDVQMVEVCMRRYREKCTAWPDVDENTARKVIDYVRLVGGADVEGLRPDRDAKSFEEAVEQLKEQRARFFDEVKLRELRLFARVEAVNRVCPDEKSAKRGRALNFGLEVDYTRFWDESADDYARARATFEREAAAEEAVIRKEWPKKRCAKTLDSGRDVLAQLLMKVTPHIEDTDLKVHDSYRWSLTFTTFWKIGLGLMSEIDPSIVEKIHEIERR